MLKIDLVNGWFWDNKDFSIWRLVPGDLETESRLVILRAVEKLQELFRRRTSADSVVLEDWWENFQIDYPPRFQRGESPQAIKLDTFLAAAEQVLDTKFQDWLEDVETAVGEELR